MVVSRGFIAVLDYILLSYFLIFEYDTISNTALGDTMLFLHIIGRFQQVGRVKNYLCHVMDELQALTYGKSATPSDKRKNGNFLSMIMKKAKFNFTICSYLNHGCLAKKSTKNQIY